MQHWLSHSLKLVWRLILASNVIQMRSNDFFPQYMFSRIIWATLDEKWGSQVLEIELWGDKTGPYTQNTASILKMLFLIHATYHYTFIAGIFASIKPLMDGSLSVNKVCKNHKGLKLHREEPSFRLAFIFLIGYYLIFHATSGVCNSKNGRVMAISLFSPNLRIF